MKKYLLSDNHVEALFKIISDANIKGKDAPIIIELANIFKNPIIEDQKKEDSKEIKK